MKFFRTFLAIIVVLCIASLTGCSSDADLNPIVGTWRNIDAGGICISDWIISKDGSFDYSAYSDSEEGGCYEIDLHGTWAVANGLFYINITDSSEPWKLPDWYQPDIDIPLYCFITSTGKLSITCTNNLSITGEESIYERDGSGTGIIGAWIQENDECGIPLVITGNGYLDPVYCECDGTLTIYANETYDYYDCEKEFEGTYVTSGDRLTFDIGTEDEEIKYFKVFGNYLAIDDEEDLFTRQ